MPRPKRPSELAREPMRTHIGRDELAFYRGYLMGVDLHASARRLLPPGTQAAPALAYIRTQLVMAANRRREFVRARLIRLQLGARSAGEAPPAELPTLEEYREQKGYGNFYTENELLEKYLEDYPHAAQTDLKARRRARLRERQIEALDYLERLLVVDPKREDAIEAWFEARLARRLKRAGVTTIDELIEFVELHGARWWARVPRLGEKGAQQVLFWLQRNTEALAVSLSLRVLTPRRKLDVSVVQQALGRSSAIVPIERFAAPQDLDGSNGGNRAPVPHNMSGAANDYQAILKWLDARGSSPHTKRAYRKEAERMLLWAIFERGKAMSALTADDCTAYRDWLAALGRTTPDAWTWRLPQSDWIGPANAERLTPAWRPFDGALKKSSQQHARVVLQALFQWLCDVCYLRANPWKGVARDAPPPSEVQDEDDELLTGYSSAVDIRDRTLSRAQWEVSLASVRAQEPGEARERLLFLLLLGYGTGTRAAEIAAALCGHLRRRAAAGGEYDALLVRGKGGKVRAVPMPSPQMEALCAYLGARGLPPNPYACDKRTALIAPLAREHTGGKSTAFVEARAPRTVSTSLIYKLLKGCFAGAAQTLRRARRLDEANKLEAASTHWLRHTCGAHAVEDGVPVKVVQENFGHASVATTTIYTVQDADTRFRLMEEFQQRRAGKRSTLGKTR